MTCRGKREEKTYLTDSEEENVIRYARVLPLDIVQARGSGHAGTAVSLAPILTELFAHHLRHDPADPDWEGRDRFVLSCGHTSLSLYLQLYLWGYGVEMEDLSATRKFGSITPAHPERGVTPGVEMSTGPLGQGFASAVGMAMEDRRLEELFAPNGSGCRGPFGSRRVWCVVSDGDLFEGISSEAAALAGNLGLSNLVVIWDDNGITIDGPTSVATAEDICGRFSGDRWRVLTIDDPESLGGIRAALLAATDADDEGRPTFIRLRSRIGHPMPHLGGTSQAHAGPVGEDEIAATKRLLGIDERARLVFPAGLLELTRSHASLRARLLRVEWDEGLAAWSRSGGQRVALRDRLVRHELPNGWEEALPGFDATPLSTRAASGQVLLQLSERMPELWGGSCDLSESTSLSFSGGDVFTSSSAGRTVRFGIREHAQAAAMTGMALTGLTRPVGSTYLVFSDYQRPSLRLAALMRVAPIYVWTHDSLAVGEDGPSHQPVEQMASLRTVPGLSVIRPADALETREAWRVLMVKTDGPAGLVLSRQALPVLKSDEDVVREGVGRGGYVLRDYPLVDADERRVILMASGSEVRLAIDAQILLAHLNISSRVVSMPCFEWFTSQPVAYRQAVLPPSTRARVSIEAGVAQPWGEYVGADGASISVEHFGASGDGEAQLRAAGFSADNVVRTAQQVLSRLHGGS